MEVVLEERLINQLGCSNGTAGSGYNQLYVGGLVLGQTYLIRISSTAANVGTFELCVNNYTPPPPASADCGGAGKLCSKNPLSVSTLSGGGSNPNEPANETNSCMTGDIFTDAESNSVWYTWTCGTSGTLLFDLTPLDPSNDIDYVLYQLSGTNPCGGRTIIRCNTSACLNATGSTGLSATDTDISEDPGCDPGENAYCQQINMVAGTSYAILINNANGNTGFNIVWGGTGTFLGPDPNIIASDTTICAGESVTFDGSTSTNYSSLDWSFNPTGSPVTTATGVGPHTVVFPNTGTYVAILQATSSLGCTAVEYKNIIVGSASTISVTSAAICPGASTVLTASGASSYTWSTGATTSTISVSPVSPTSYTVTGGVGTCTNTQIASVTINPVPTGVNAGSSQTLTCPSNSVTLSGSVSSPTNASVNWTGANVCGAATTLTPSVCAAGIYTLTATDPANGCSANATVQIFPNAGAPTGTISSTSIALDCNNSVGSVTVTSTPNTDVTYVWNTPPATVSTDGSVATFTNANTYICTITNTISNCSVPVQVVVTSNTIVPVTTATAAGMLTCTNTSVTLNSSLSGMSYTWTAPIGGVLATTNTQNTSASGSGGTYTLSVLNTTNGCTYSTTAVVVQNTVAPTGVSAGPNQTLTCLSNSVSLAGSVATPTNATENWTGASICGSATTLTTSACAVGIYTLTATDPSNGCTSKSTVQVFPNAGASLLSISSSSLILDCNNATRSATVTATPSNDLTYSWNPAPLSGSTSSNASFNSAGTFVCTVTNTLTSCSSSIQVVVTQNNSLPTVTVSNTIIPCNSNTVNIIAVSSPTNVTYSWTTLNGTIVSGGTTGTVTVSSAGNYVITVKDNSNGCVNTATSNVTSLSINAAFTANPLSGTAPLLVNFTNQSTGAAAYSWNFGDSNNNISTLSNPDHTYNLPGVYVVTLTATDAFSVCSVSATTTITVLENSVLIVPNVFTPNGDGSNDHFKIIASGMKDLTCDIFNRWGTKVYTIKSADDFWDGGNHSSGTYFYILKCTGLDGKDYSQQGYLNLFK
ncbi:MAG: gliding motility-associated C-terminal domain-containing protein [Bacteroidetes bacterium]|nr:gliding motility-associated C-terminal domain-containing protein [Bacteroidota bacterium]